MYYNSNEVKKNKLFLQNFLNGNSDNISCDFKSAIECAIHFIDVYYNGDYPTIRFIDLPLYKVAKFGSVYIVKINNKEATGKLEDCEPNAISLHNKHKIVVANNALVVEDTFRELTEEEINYINYEV